MATAVSVQSPWLYTVPYLTTAEFKAAPTATDIMNLYRGGDINQQESELVNVVARASAWVNTICGQNLAATKDTETGRVRVTARGEAIVHPRYWPILEVTDFELGATPSSLTVMDLTNCWIERDKFTLTTSSLGITSSVGPLQFSPIMPETRGFARWTYVNGWATTTTSTSTAANAVSLPVKDATGIYAGTVLSVYDAASTETVTVTSVSGNTLTVPALTYAHASGISVSSLPPSVKEACIALTSAFVKARGNAAIVLAQIHSTPSQHQPKDTVGTDVDIAKELLTQFRVVR